MLEKRKKGYIYFKGNIYFIEEINKVLEENNLHIEGMYNSKKIIGSSACRGIIKGKARLIFKLSQLSDLEKGEILVTPMTTPDFVPYLEKVAAIVTDEGGITSHAAIIAREFNIPTIVGTSNATKILKSGDLIEVDAHNGAINVLE